jgi:hypothetical protein
LQDSSGLLMVTEWVLIVEIISVSDIIWDFYEP